MININFNKCLFKFELCIRKCLKYILLGVNMEQIEIKSSQIFGIIKKIFPIYLNYIKYFTLLFIVMFVSLGLTATIIYLINCNQSWNAIITNSSSQEIIINKGNYHLFLQWLFSNKNAIYIGFAASFFGFASCLSVLIEAALTIKSNKMVNWKLWTYTLVFILLFVASFMISFGFNNSNIPIGISNNIIQTQGSTQGMQVITITDNQIKWSTIVVPGASDTSSEIKIPVELNPKKGNYISYLVSTISISVLGNVLYLINKILKKFNIKIVWDGFKNKKDNDKVNAISDDLLELDNDDNIKDTKSKIDISENNKIDLSKSNKIDSNIDKAKLNNSKAKVKNKKLKKN